MDAPGRDVGRDERGDLTAAELLQCAGALRLGLAPVQRRGPHTLREEPGDQVVRGLLGVDEHDHPAVAGGDVGDRGVLVGVLHVQHVMLHRADRSRGRIHRVRDRILQEAPHQAVDVAVQGGGEQHRLAAVRDLFEERGDLGQEAHVGHLVGLVEDGDGDPVQAAEPAFDQVPQSAGRGDQDLRAAVQHLRLAADRHPADHGGRPQPRRLGVRGEGLGDLLRELTGGDQDQRERAPRFGLLPGGTGQQGETERERLAGAGAAPRQHVASGQRVRQRRGLDREGSGDAPAGQDRQQFPREVQFVEGLDGGQRRHGAHRHGELLPRGVPGVAAHDGPAAGGPARRAAGTVHAVPPRAAGDRAGTWCCQAEGPAPASSARCGPLVCQAAALAVGTTAGECSRPAGPSGPA